MDGFRRWEEEYEGALLAYEPAVEAPTGPVLDDRRTYVRAFNQWVARLGDRPCPDIRDLEPDCLEGSNSLLLDLRGDAEDPKINFTGKALRKECWRGGIGRLSQVPEGSILRCLAAHYRAAMETGQPIAFDGEHVRPAGRTAMYRGILLPYTSGSGAVDLIHGMINWREAADVEVAAGIAFEMGRALASASPIGSGALQMALPDAAALVREMAHPELPLAR
ncbi:MAG TPA: hypothetical protein VGD10_03240 [Allosphingosinicella sp.]|uniref:hypothetical protein n=1 Tax=Allosphingosinicella sp. TaxID=2823234 RepID=UPI002ED7763B